MLLNDLQVAHGILFPNENKQIDYFNPYMRNKNLKAEFNPQTN